MEQVPGGSLSALLRSKWGPLKDNEATIAFYTRQILKGIKYLHDNKIVHRDIKGDNVLVNTYSGILKISDFGTSKRLSGINPMAGTFAGTLQYMAPEVIDKGVRGYGPPADIWSLGCTVIEMATGKPPFIELGPEAAMFKVGFYKIHPEFPPTLSEGAKDFLERCFDPDADLRATAADLLEHPFLDDAPKKKRKHQKPDQRNSLEYNRSISVPVGRLEGGRPGTPTSPGSPSQLSSPDLHLRIPRDRDSFCSSTYEPTTPPHPSPTPDSEVPPDTGSSKDGFWILRKDSERRSTLVKVLTEDQDMLCERWLQHLTRDNQATSRKVNKDHLVKLLVGLREYIRDPQSTKSMQISIDKLKEEVDFDMTALHELQLAVYGFQEVVGEILRQHRIQPHWMFALDTVLRGASQQALSILMPDLAAHILGEGSQGAAAGAPQEEESTSGVSTFDSSNRPPDLSRLDRVDSRELLGQLRDLEEENKRLLERVIESQMMYQELLKATIERNQLHASFLKTLNDSASPVMMNNNSVRSTVDASLHHQGAAGDSKTSSESPSGCSSHQVDNDMVVWLQSLEVDQDTIDKLIQEKYTKKHLLNWVTREDLRRLNLRGGMTCRMWESISEYRKQYMKSRENSPS